MPKDIKFKMGSGDSAIDVAIKRDTLTACASSIRKDNWDAREEVVKALMAAKFAKKETDISIGDVDSAIEAAKGELAVMSFKDNIADSLIGFAETTSIMLRDPELRKHGKLSHFKGAVIALKAFQESLSASDSYSDVSRAFSYVRQVERDYKKYEAALR